MRLSIYDLFEAYGETNRVETLQIDLSQGSSVRIRGMYSLRFDMGIDGYVTLKKGAENLLIKGYDMRLPEGFRITESLIDVKKVKLTEVFGNSKITLVDSHGIVLNWQK